ncbi:MAG: nucleotidyltransferase domain-containing protein [Gammaproteobacteria bacterium]|nr:nucleotidyltransferase domain-containing protein [Gammaproteobacteria bacterium]
MIPDEIAADPEFAGVLARFAGAVRERFGEAVLDIRLFGSYARSDAHEDSDVDIAVVLEAAGWETRRDIIDLAADFGLAHDLTLSPTVFDRETWERWRAQDRPLVRDIELEGIRL